MEDLKARLRFLVRLFKDTGDRWSEIEGFRLGASFSYYATFAIFPLLLLTVTAIGFVIGDDTAARDRLLAAVAAPGSSSGHLLEQTMTAMQESRSARGTSAVIAMVSLLFSASGAFIELDATLNKIWGVRPRKGRGVLGTVRTFLQERLTGFTLVLGLGATLLASLVTSSLLGAIAAHAPERFAPALLQTAEIAASLVLLSGVFALMFHLVPRTRPPFRDVIGGAVLTTVFLTILKTVFAAYLAHLTSYSAYGVVGGVLALATWIYLSSQIIFLGATLTRAHCEARHCPQAASPERDATGAEGTAQAAGE